MPPITSVPLDFPRSLSSAFPVVFQHNGYRSPLDNNDFLGYYQPGCPEYVFIHIDPPIAFIHRGLKGSIKFSERGLLMALASNHRGTLFGDLVLFFVHYYTIAYQLHINIKVLDLMSRL